MHMSTVQWPFDANFAQNDIEQAQKQRRGRASTCARQRDGHGCSTGVHAP